VLAKAVERGLVTAEQATGMSEREALHLIFLPGFSTAAAVTHVSGRGVGMDVVRSNVEKVGGSVEVESRVGVGTTLRLRVPLTLAIVPALVVRSGGQSFALPQSALAELLYVAEKEVAMAVERMGGAEFYRLRERLLPLVWLDRLLRLEGASRSSGQGFYVAVLEGEGRRYGLVVDELLAPEEIVVKPLSAVLREIGLYSGATVLGNGTLALILDVGEVAERAGVKVVDAGPKSAEVVADVEMASAKSSLLVFEEWDGARKALPLEGVERIESVPLESIERVGGRAVLQYRGEILMLEDVGGVVEAMRLAGNVDGVVTILICKAKRGAGEGMRRSGRVVKRVLDVTEGTFLAADQVDRERLCEDELALVHERVTVVCRRTGSTNLLEVA
jgi:two-component system chemotaxis sensor kinase CheA